MRKENSTIQTKFISEPGSYLYNADYFLFSEEEVDNSFFGKIKAFFQRIIDWFKNLFK